MIKLPTSYSFGISAASAENPDSFEVFKFVTTTDSYTPDGQDPSQANKQQFSGAGEAQSSNENKNEDPSLNDPPEAPASAFHSQDAQFADLHNRLQAMMKHLGSMNRHIIEYQANAKSQNEKLVAQISDLSTALSSKLDDLASMKKKIDEIESNVRKTKSDLTIALDKHVKGLTVAVTDTHHSLLGSVAENAPSFVMYVFVVLGSQVLLIVAYLVYKRRKANGPKKYL